MHMHADRFKRGLLVSLNQVTLRVRDKQILAGTSWDIHTGEHWAVVGPNGAGKSTLVRALTGEVPVVRGEIFPPEPASLRQQAACLSFEHQRRLIEQEERRDEHHAFSGRLDGGFRVGDFIRLARPRRGERHRPADALERIQIEPLLERRIRELSSGEMRRFQIALALSASPRLLILDEPYEGLDPEYRAELAKIINELMGPDRSVVLVTHRRREIPPNATHVIGVKAGQVVFQGRREDVLGPGRMDRLYALESSVMRETSAARQPRVESGDTPSEVLVDLRNVTVGHHGVPVFENLCWTVRSGQHWAVCGPNGSGKTTLLSLIAGDHPQAYTNTVRVFGKLRGGGGASARSRRASGSFQRSCRCATAKPSRRKTSCCPVFSIPWGSTGEHHEISRRPPGRGWNPSASSRWQQKNSTTCPTASNEWCCSPGRWSNRHGCWCWTSPARGLIPATGA